MGEARRLLAKSAIVPISPKHLLVLQKAIMKAIANSKQTNPSHRGEMFFAQVPKTRSIHCDLSDIKNKTMFIAPE